MESKELKTILNMQEENTLLHRAINDATVMLKRREKHLVLEYDIDCISWLFHEIGGVLEELHETQKPSQKSE